MLDKNYFPWQIGHVDDKKIIFSLNPGLKIESVSSNGGELSFKRDEHLAFVALASPLEPGE
jgi:hypothetical protein